MAVNPLVARRARVQVEVTRPNAKGEQVVQTYTFSDHRMRIAVRQGGNQFGNAKVDIFGVPLITMNQIARLWLETLTPQNTDKMSIDVWDGKGWVSFFQGVISWSAVDASAMPQVKLTIEANAAMALMNLTASPYANAGPVRLQDAIAAVAQIGAFSVDYSTTAPTYQLTNVRVSGSPMEQIAELMRAFPDLTWFVNLQRLIVRKVNAPYSADQVIVSAETGLQGFPVYSTSGLQFQTVFNPLLRPGAALDVRSAGIDFVNRTQWVAAVLAHNLDANLPGGQWTTACAANSFGQKGNTQ